MNLDSINIFPSMISPKYSGPFEEIINFIEMREKFYSCSDVKTALLVGNVFNAVYQTSEGKT